jgi:hypothetical protein
VNEDTQPLQFDEGTHTFTRAGVLVPSVTQCIKAAGLVNDRGYNDWSRDRGVRVHTAMFLLTQSSEDAALASLDEDDVPYFDAALLWMRTHHVEVLAAEQMVDGGSYGGWLDLRCRMRGHERLAVVDLKTGSLPKWAGLQLAAYAAPFAETHERYAVRLMSNGEPRMQMYRDPSDWYDFRCCTRIWQLQQQMNPRSNGDD